MKCLAKFIWIALKNPVQQVANVFIQFHSGFLIFPLNVCFRLDFKQKETNYVESNKKWETMLWSTPSTCSFCCT